MRYAHAPRAALLCTLAVIPMMMAAPSAHAAAPRIGGTPQTEGTVGQRYSFRPWAWDRDHDRLRFFIRNKPRFAQFSSRTGQLWGTPSSRDVRTWRHIVISVTDGHSTVSLPAFSIVVRPNGSGGNDGSGNEAPVISGTPPTSVRAGEAYAFTPTASDPNKDPLTFSIANKPAWATFSTSTGKLSGTPGSSSVGTYPNIVISVSDGKAKSSLAAFTITVAAASGGSGGGTTTGSATVSWVPPTQNVDGSALTNLAGYRIKYGQSASALTRTIDIDNPGISRFVIDDLSSGTWYFAVTAYNSAGAESALSNIASKRVP